MGASARRVIQSKDLKRFVEVDGVHNALVQINEIHKKIHSGELFQFSARSTIGAGLSMNLFIQTGSCLVHARFLSSPQRLTNYTLYEGATAGSAILTEPKNRNRASSNAAKVRFSFESSVSEIGTTIALDYQGQAAGGGNGRGEIFGREEWVLEANSLYLFKAFNLTGNSSTIALAVECYETVS